MPTGVVGLASIVEARHQGTARARPDLAVVEADFLDECSCLPPLHPRGGTGNPVDGAALDRHVAADFVKIQAPKHLVCTGHVVEVGCVVGIGVLVRPVRGLIYPK